MKRINLLSTIIVFSLIALGCLQAQSIISGDITGVVTDPTGAVLPGATVTLKNLSTGTSQTTTTNSQGVYRFALVPSGTYNLTVNATGFQSTQRNNVSVTAGQATTADVQLNVASASTTVNVTEAAVGVQTENADVSTSYNTQSIENMPNPGGDLTYIAQSAPGVIMNTQGGYGNFSAFGLPATSNLFTINGQNFNDPYLNLNNSGASNLALGSNELAEANVVNNGYSAQYGQFAGSQVNYITKSGTNGFHGNAIYYWNGRTMNANDFFSNAAGEPRPFLNFNQWATDVGGPIWKNHTFFNVNYEGYRVVEPSASVLVKIPSPQFQAATIANLNATGHANEVPFYQQFFNVYNNSPSAHLATPVAGGGCGSFTTLGAGVPCALSFRTTQPNSGKEYQWAARVDHTFSEKDRAYVRVFRDNGTQPTYTDPINPIFNAYSPQPQMSAQLTENHTFGSTAVNQVNVSALFYSAAFLHSNAAAATAALPTVVRFSGSLFSNAGGTFYNFPQGRRVSQYQIIDDFSKVYGRHTFRVGFSWLRDNVTELGYQVLTQGLETVSNLSQFYSGVSTTSTLSIRFPSAGEQPLKYDTFGGYVSDDWRITDRLTASLNLRMENYSNPVCGHSCFSVFGTPFTGAAVSASTPYNQTISANRQNAFLDTPTLVWEPRIGIAWRPTGSDRTVIRTGAGIFADELPGVLARDLSRNTPELNSFTVRGGAFAPGVPNSLFTIANQANQALLNQFASGGTLASIQQQVPGFATPNFTSVPNVFKQPTYYKWNFEVQQAIGAKMVFSMNYVGTHGIHIPVADNSLNAYCPASVCPGGFAGLPSSQPDPRFGTITQYLSAGTSNYNGLTLSLQRRFGAAFTYNLNYTWSHALDTVSNGGILRLDLNTDASILNPQDPHNIKRFNYGNADQDVRHDVSMTWMLTDTFRHAGMHWGPKSVFGGWTLSGNMFFRTGLPFTVVDTSVGGALAGFGYGGTIFATPVTNHFAECDKKAVDTPCLTTSEFLPSPDNPRGFGLQTRNSFRGPRFFDMDLALMKDIRIKEKFTFSFGAQAFNVLNHPSFDKPDSDLASSTFGSITGLATPPTSILGAFFGAGASPRFLEIKGKIQF